MLARFAIVLILAVLAATSAHANTTLYNDVSWKSTQCAEPSPPAALPSNPETPADQMNASVVAYDNYSKKGHAYMECLVSEATRDSATGGQSVDDQAQAMINAEQKKVMAVGESFEARMPAR